MDGPQPRRKPPACPPLATAPSKGRTLWKLVDPEEREIQIRHEPKLITDDMVLVRQAAVHGVGIAQLRFPCA